MDEFSPRDVLEGQVIENGREDDSDDRHEMSFAEKKRTICPTVNCMDSKCQSCTTSMSLAKYLSDKFGVDLKTPDDLRTWDIFGEEARYRRVTSMDDNAF